MLCSVCHGSGLSPGSERFGGFECGACLGSGQLADHPSSTSSKKAEPYSQTAVSSAVDLDGWWQGSDGLGYHLVQQGDNLWFKASNPFNGEVLVQGNGQVSGFTLHLNFTRVDGMTGDADGRVSPDMHRMRVVSRNVFGQSTHVQLVR